jgi:hypothetical protein
LACLAEANAKAADLGLDLWEFAVEIRTLLETGLKHTDLRWLICRGYAEHARERSRATDCRRHFTPMRNLACYPDTCFVLTPLGMALFRSQVVPPREANRPADRPRWEDGRRRLVWGDWVVKEFRLPADNQETILSALEEESWPPRIDDPLPPVGEQDPKARLHDAIKGLNRRQRHRLIRFRGDGTGRGILWESYGGCGHLASFVLSQAAPYARAAPLEE